MGFIYASANGGGIVNRLNTIISAIVAQKYTHKKIIVHWNDTHNSCLCKLTDIFNQGDTSKLEICENVTFPTENYYLFCDLGNAPFLQKEKNLINYNTISKEQFIEFCTNLSDSTDIIINTPIVFTFDIPITELVEEFHKLLVPRNDFKEIIYNFLLEHYFQIGLHIRLTEKIIVNGYDMNNFHTDIQTILETYPNSNFLICSDDSNIENEVMNLVPNSCHYPKTALLEKVDNTKPFLWWDENKDLGYAENLVRNKQYSYDGFIDLYLLGCSKHIVGINTKGSTYNILANWFSEYNIREKLFS